MSEIYEKLRHSFDSMASGFPKTESGSEINLLKLLYNEKEAALFIDMTQKPETPRQVAIRLQRDENQLASDLELMARKGLLFRKRCEGKTFYSAPPFVVGVLEFQIKRLEKEPELSAAIGMYGLEGFLKSLTAGVVPHQRTIPINSGIVNQWPIATHDDALAILDQHRTIGVVACTCRTLMNSIGIKGCQNPIENCLGFDDMADYYIENHFARKISKDEAASILANSNEHGMVLQPFNGKNAGAICSCCGDCCAMLRSLDLNPSPAEAVKSSYYAAIEDEECTGCELCLSRCQIKALTMNEDDIAVVDLNRCIGCGLCVTTCPSEALHLIKKPESDLYEPPADIDEAHRIMAAKRGFIQTLY
jgi:ferredoxin